jgi:K+-transporting ATPase ATPase C chain
MRRQFATGFVMNLVLLVLMGLIFPVAVWGVGQLLFNDRADGSLVKRDGVVVGSSLLGQNFTEPQYFHPRPSAAGDGYDPLASGASNLGPSSEKLLDGVADDPATPDEDESFDGVTQRVAKYREENGLAPDAEVPIDAVTASGSGLDPNISVANARLQAARVAETRGIPVETVMQAIDDHTQGRQWGFLGEKAVNVLNLNLALDAASR